MTPAPQYLYRACLVKVVDADTLDVTIDLGFTVKVTQRVRLDGLNAPERNTQAGQAAMAWVKDWLRFHEADVPSCGLVLKSHKPGGGDKYGRYLATVWAPEHGVCLNDELIDAGHAKAWDGQGAKPV